MPFQISFKNTQFPPPITLSSSPLLNLSIMTSSSSSSPPLCQSTHPPLTPTIFQSPLPNHPLISLLNNCNTMNQFKQIHSQMILTGIARSPAEQRAMVSFCCAHDPGDMNYARLLFDGIRHPDPFVWNSMIRGHSIRNSAASALLVYIEMLANGFEPNDYTFPFLLKAFTREFAVVRGDGLRAHILKFGFGSNPFVRNSLIHMYSRSGEIKTARKLFAKSSKRDAVMWNSMISGYNRSKQFQESCKLFESMKKENVKPTSITLVSVISACAKLKDLDYGSQIHRSIEDDGMVFDLKLENALIDMYAGCGDMNTAWRLFESMEARDVISWTAIVSGFAKSGQVDRARELFDRMPDRDIVSWTALIDGYVRASRFKEALDIFGQMQAAKIRPDEFTMVSVLTACAQLGALGIGEWVRTYMDHNKIKADIFVGNALIDMYSKCGSMESAAEVFRKMDRRDKFTWTTMIVGFALNGNGEEALDLFFEMLEASVRPDEITFIGVLSACVHSGGLVDKGREIFSSMMTTHGIVPNVSHYGCLVDLLGRARQLGEALETINKMPMRPNSAVWGALLGACGAHGDVEMAELAARRLVELEPENGAAAVYVLLSNVYAKGGKWEEVRKVRKTIMERGIRKMPGCSLIEMDGVVTEFVAGDRSHRRTSEIYSKVEEMGREMRLAGYVPDASEALLNIGEEEKENTIY